jgi:hypothetical protein
VRVTIETPLKIGINAAITPDVIVTVCTIERPRLADRLRRAALQAASITAQLAAAGAIVAVWPIVWAAGALESKAAEE